MKRFYLYVNSSLVFDIIPIEVEYEIDIILEKFYNLLCTHSKGCENNL